MIFEYKPFLYAINANRNINRRATSDISNGFSPDTSRNLLTSSPAGGAVNRDMRGIATQAKNELVIIIEIPAYM